jgi:general secretion pathway protein J
MRLFEARRCCGFTLVELLVAMVVLSFLSAAVAGVLHTARRFSEATDRLAHETGSVRTTHALLRRILSSAIPIMSAVAGKRRLLFDGERDRLTLVGQLPRATGLQGLAQLTIENRRIDGTQSLVLRYAPLHPERKLTETDRGWTQVVIARGIDKVQWQYFGVDTSGSSPKWRSLWNHDRFAPMAISLLVTDSEGVDWPELIVATRVVRPRPFRSDTLGAKTPPAAADAPSPPAESPAVTGPDSASESAVTSPVTTESS